MKSLLFARGFLMTSKQLDQAGYPFYGEWNHTIFSGYHFYIHPKQKLFTATGDKRSCFLIGHAYNPFSMEISEEKILQTMLNCDHEELYCTLDELTGVFTFGYLENGALTLIADCAGMQIAYYGVFDGELYVSSHMQMIGDLLNLSVSNYVNRLIHYRFYHYYGAFLPGDLSSYDGLRRIVPNTEVTYSEGSFSVHRFYPVRDLTMRDSDELYNQGLHEAADIFRRTMELITLKWEHPAISMTGGMDSKGTLAAANGIYNKFDYFSYISMPGEKIDADAAHKIAQAIGVEHRIDYISDQDTDYPDIEDIRLILEHNFGNIGAINRNDVRKRMFYLQKGNCPFDVEVKSWVSEIARANYYKKFGFQKMPKHLSARQMTTMYKLFINNRRLVRDTDRVFADYIKTTSFDAIYNYDSSDMFLWEMRYGGWGGQVITCEHKLSFDITIPYNNRKLIELLLSMPIEKRISDQLHYDLIKFMNPAIDQTGITIVNANETKKRMWIEKLYFLLHTRIPF